MNTSPDPRRDAFECAKPRPTVTTKMGDTLAAALDDPATQDDGSFARPEQGEMERGVDLFDCEPGSASR